MLNTIVTSIAAFGSTNLDDLIVLMLLFSQAKTGKERQNIFIGQYLGAAILIAVSVLIAFGMGFLPGQYLRWLGLIPIALGVRVWLNRGKTEENQTALSAGSVTLFCLANGADNIGIYIPLFAGSSLMELTIFAAVYAVMLALWCQLSRKLLAAPVLGSHIQKYKDILVPVAFILLGIYILLK